MTVEWHLSAGHALLHAKVSLFGLIRGALPIFSQVPVLLNQELDSCFFWQTQGSACLELPLLDGGVGRVGDSPGKSFPMEVCPVLKPSKASPISGSAIEYVVPNSSRLFQCTRTCT